MQIGIKGEKKFTVTKDQLACNVGSGLVSVFATPMMIAAIENTAAGSVAGELEEGKTTVGTLVNVSHVAATPEGMEVRIETELTEIAPNGKMLTFKVAAYDEAGLIGEGTHQRAIVAKERFEQKAQSKLSKEKSAKEKRCGEIPQRFLLVRVTGLEPARRGHQNLNLARLPIPPYPRVRLVYPFCGYLSILMMVLIGSGALAKRAESALTPRGRTRG